MSWRGVSAIPDGALHQGVTDRNAAGAAAGVSLEC